MKIIFLNLCLFVIGVHLSVASNSPYSVDNIPVLPLVTDFSEDVHNNVPPLEKNLIKLSNITESLNKTSASTGKVLCFIPEMLHIFGDIYGDMNNLVSDIKTQWPAIVNEKNPSHNAIKVPANIMNEVYGALVQVGPVLVKLDAQFQLDEKLVTGICTAYRTIGPHGNGLLYLQNNLAGRVLNLTGEIVHSNKELFIIINKAINMVNEYQKNDNQQKPIGVVAKLCIRIVENIIKAVENVANTADNYINNSVAKNFIVEQITPTEQTMNIDVTVHHTLVLFENIAKATQAFIMALEIIQGLLSNLDQLNN